MRDQSPKPRTREERSHLLFLGEEILPASWGTSQHSQLMKDLTERTETKQNRHRKKKKQNTKIYDIYIYILHILN